MSGLNAMPQVPAMPAMGMTGMSGYNPAAHAVQAAPPQPMYNPAQMGTTARTGASMGQMAAPQAAPSG